MTGKRFLAKKLWQANLPPLPTEVDGRPVHQLHLYRWTRVHDDVEVKLLRTNQGVVTDKVKIKVRSRGGVFGHKPEIMAGRWLNIGGFIEVRLVEDSFVTAYLVARLPVPLQSRYTAFAG